ncbi:phage tail tip fiber protein [Pseudomonas putida]
MPSRKARHDPAPSPFRICGDGRVYINRALIADATITKAKVTGQPRAAS